LTRAAARRAVAAAVLLAAALAPARAGAIFASPIHGACFATREGCRIHLEPFTIQVAPGQRLESFQIYAGGNPAWDFRTDVSNPPLGPYAPTLPKLGFAARCEQSYVVNLVGRDSGDASSLNLGQTAPLTCPVPEPSAAAAGLAASAALAALRGRRRARR